MMSDVLAETVSLDGGVVLVALIVVLVALALSVAAVVLGFALAPRAARGSTPALAVWTAVVAAEGLFCVWLLVGAVEWGFSPLVLAAPVLVAAQVAVFLSARGER